MVMWRIDDAQVRDVATGELLRDLVGAAVQIVQRDTTAPVPIFDAVGDPIADSMLTVTPVFTVPRFWVDTDDAAGLYLDWYHAPNDVRGTVEFEAVLRDAALAAADAASASETAAVDAAAAAEAAAVAPTVEMVTPLVAAAVDAEMAGLPDIYALTSNAAREVTFGEPQHEDLTTYTYPNLLDFGPVFEPTPVATPGASRNLDIVAHWYNDFGLDKEALAANQANGAYTWYDWSWNFPTNTGDGQTARGYDPQRHPLQGFYKGDDPRVLGWQCKWLAEAGVNAVSLVQTDGFKRVNGSGVSWSNPASASYWVYRLFNETPNFRALRWVAWLDSNGTAEEIAAQVDEVIWLWQNYPGGYTYTENGKTYPVLFLWDGELLRGALDNYVNANNTRAHLISVADEFKTLGYDGVYVMARNGGVVSSNYGTYDLHEDGVLYGNASYNDTYSPPVGDSYSNDFAQYAAKAVFPVPASRGYGTVGVVTSAYSVYPHPSNFPLAGSTPEAFGLVLRRAADHIVKYDRPRILTIGNVSEWAESGPGLIPNVADGFGYLDQLRALPAYGARGVGSNDAVNVQVFTANGTWIKPAGATSVHVALFAGGGGGVSGAVAPAGTAAAGGAGGGAGGRTFHELPASSLAGSVNVTVGAGGTGGPSQFSAAGSAASVDGTAGADTTFGVLKAFGGGRGQGVAGGGGGGGGFTGLTGGNASATGGAGTSVTTATGIAPGGGGGGGGVTSADAATAGGYGGSVNMVIPQNAATATTTGANGVTRFDAAADSGMPGGGGSGGGGSATANGGNGGAGGKYGAGGGGGGGCRSGFDSGAGGAGGPGIAIVVTHF